MDSGPPGIVSGPSGYPGFESVKSSNMSGMEDAEIERVLREYDVFQAAKAGLLIPCQEIVDRLGVGVLHQYDREGHTPLHWAALGGHSHVVRFFIECRAPVDMAARNELGAQPIHWAASGGHVPVVDLLLEAGAAIDATDNKGCSPLITASQYARTNLTGYLLGRGARYQLVDREGDNALHWAAFKGNAEMCRLLIYSGFNPKQRDNFGQTPLHLGALSGNLNCVKVLVEQEVELEAVDFNGNSPRKLAEGRKHWETVRYLERSAARQKSVIPIFDLQSVIFGPPGRRKTTMHFMLVILIFLAYPTYFLRILPTVTLEGFPLANLIFWCANFVLWVNMIRTHNTDPGVLPRNTEEYSEKIKAVARYDKWEDGEENPLSRLCHTCRCVKPLRAKHCKIINRCIKRFDHHCAYVGNSIGYHNQHHFYLFVASTVVMLWTFHYIAYQTQHQEAKQDWWLLFCQIICGVFTFLVTPLFIGTSYNAVKNLTTNEQVNFRRYEYLKNSMGQFSNPFDRGAKENLKEFFHLKRSVEEVTTQNPAMSV